MIICVGVKIAHLADNYQVSMLPIQNPFLKLLYYMGNLKMNKLL